MKVDILIPSKDRPAQLHQLLSTLSRNVEGVGQITITIQASNEKFKKGYEILNERLFKDGHFKTLRSMATIIILYRNKLSEFDDALNHLGDSKLLLILADDEIFFGSINFKNNLAIKKFIDDQSIHTCAIRLGRNITPNVPNTHSHFIKTQPSFINQSSEYLIWTWPDNLDIDHWSCIYSVTGHIYRKNEFIKTLRLVAKDNFLQLEKKAPKYLVKDSFYISLSFLSFIEYIDYVLERFLFRFVRIISQPVIFNFLVKSLFKMKVLRKKNSKIKMISLMQSVTAAISINSSHELVEDSYPFMSNERINQKYLKGYVFSKDIMNFIKFDEPNLIDSNKIVGIKFEKYIDLPQ